LDLVQLLFLPLYPTRNKEVQCHLPRKSSFRSLSHKNCHSKLPLCGSKYSTGTVDRLFFFRVRDAEGPQGSRRDGSEADPGATPTPQGERPIFESLSLHDYDNFPPLDAWTVSVLFEAFRWGKIYGRR